MKWTFFNNDLIWSGNYSTESWLIFENWIKTILMKIESKRFSWAFDVIFGFKESRFESGKNDVNWKYPAFVLQISFVVEFSWFKDIYGYLLTTMGLFLCKFVYSNCLIFTRV